MVGGGFRGIQQMFHRMAELIALVHVAPRRMMGGEFRGTDGGPDILHHCEHIVEAAERTARCGSTGDCLRQLRRLCVDEFALLLHAMPDKRYPGLSSLLPAMAPVDVQRQWTGATGMTLLKIRVAFIEKIRRHYSRVTGRPLEGARILDYGCGYGLMLRLMYYFTDPERIAGCDPWDLAIRHCKDARIGCRLDVTDYLPASLPYEDETFDLVLAYSVFTHTSRRASVAALEAISPVIRPNGLLVLTIRPREYWAYPTAETSEVQQSALLRAHDETGFAFRPHNRPPIDGDVTFGDTSMKVETIEELCPEWKVIGYDWSLPDLLQLIVLLQKRGAA